MYKKKTFAVVLRCAALGAPLPAVNKQVDLSEEDADSQEVLAILLIILTLSLLVAAVVECLLESRRLSRGDNSDSDTGHVFLRRDTKPKDSNGSVMGDDKDKFRTSRGLLHAPKLLDVPENRVKYCFIVFVIVRS